MGYESGAVKWIFGMLVTPVGYASLYIFGDGIWNTITNFQALLHLLRWTHRLDILLSGLVDIYVPTPGSVLGTLIVYPLIGGIVGALLLYQATKPEAIMAFLESKSQCQYVFDA